jgi:hypothetical protein
MRTRLHVAGRYPPEQSLALVKAAYSRSARDKRKGLEAWMIPAIERQHDLERVVRYRFSEGLAMGPDAGWALAIANLCRYMDGSISADSIRRMCAALGRPALDEGNVTAVVLEIGAKTYSRYRLQSARAVGSLIELTSVEREEIGIRMIDAVDEPARVRSNRLKREAMRRTRAAKAAAPRVSVEKEKPWESEGISRRTWYYRRRKDGCTESVAIPIEERRVTPQK